MQWVKKQKNRALAHASFREKIIVIQSERKAMYESRRVGLGTTVEYMERKFKAKVLEAPCREKPSRNRGSNLRHQIA